MPAPPGLLPTRLPSGGCVRADVGVCFPFPANYQWVSTRGRMCVLPARVRVAVCVGFVMGFQLQIRALVFGGVHMRGLLWE